MLNQAFLPVHRLTLLGLAIMGATHFAAVQAAPSQCTESAVNQPQTAGKYQDRSSGAPVGVVGSGDPITQLQLLVREASRRSAEVGAARLLAEASDFDVEEVQAGRRPQVNLSGNVGVGQNSSTGRDSKTGLQANLGVNVSAPLYDGGRLKSLTEWRTRLADAAKQGQGATEERVALEAVNTALERHRYRMQAQVYHQYVRKMGCLVEALEQIVAEDKGRASELVQARKSQQQAELQREVALSTTRQFDIRLRKLVGDQLLLGESFSTPLMSTPNLDEVQRLIERSQELQQIRLQVDAQESYAQAVATGNKPQVNWTFGKSASHQPGVNTSSWAAGVQVNWAIYNGGGQEAATKAALKRADAARQSFQETLNTRMARVGEIHESAVSAMERAKRYVEVLRDSDRVRSFTYQQWSQLGRRSLFDVMSAEADHFAQRVAYVNALVDGAQANASLRSQGIGLLSWMQVTP